MPTGKRTDQMLNYGARLLLGVAASWLWLPVLGAAAQTTPVTPTTRPVITADDYPVRADGLGAQGVVVVEVAVSASGVVTGCMPVEVEWPGADLWETTCRIWTQRARYAPARDASGVPIAGVFRASIRWIHPDPGQPPSPTSERRWFPQIRCEEGSSFSVWMLFGESVGDFIVSYDIVPNIVDTEIELSREITLRLEVLADEITGTDTGYLRARGYDGGSLLEPGVVFVNLHYRVAFVNGERWKIFTRQDRRWVWQGEQGYSVSGDCSPFIDGDAYPSET
jgi:hypothetical protein